MSDVPRLLAWFDEGRLVRPFAGIPNTVDLARALSRLNGGMDLPCDPRVIETIGAADQYVFVLLDGLGLNLLERLPEDSFLRSHLAMEMQSVFLSSTAPAITSLVTGQYPAVHAVTSWWTHIPSENETVTILPFRTRFEREEFRMSPEKAFPSPPILPTYDRRVTSHIPAKIVSSVYSLWFRGNTKGRGYDALSEAVDRILVRRTNVKEPEFTYIYYPDIDSAEHGTGFDSGESLRALEEADRELSRLKGAARVVISSDHGHMNIDPENRLTIPPDDPILEHLEVPPAGEPRVPMFHVRNAEPFEILFRERFPDFALIGMREAEELNLFGPDPMTEESRARYGDYLAITPEPKILLYGPPKYHVAESNLRGWHGGLLPMETRIPLIIA